MKQVKVWTMPSTREMLTEDSKKGTPCKERGAEKNDTTQ